METKQTTQRSLRPLDPDHQALVDQRKAVARKPGRKAITTRDAVLAVQYKSIRSAQPKILERLIAGALDKTDPLHERCLDIMAKRVAPIAFWEALAKEEFRPDEEKNAAPVINITINGNAGISTTHVGRLLPVEDGDEPIDVEVTGERPV